MLRTGGVTQPCAPYIDCEVQTEETEEESRYLKPQNAAHTAKGSQKTADAAAQIARCGSGGSAILTAVGWGVDRRLRRRTRCIGDCM